MHPILGDPLRLRLLLLGWGLVGALLGVVVLSGSLYVYADSVDPVSTFCTTEGMLGPNGELMPYSRDGSQGCKWVDEDGDLLPGQ